MLSCTHAASARTTSSWARLHAEGDVVLHRVAEQEAVLRHVGDVPPQHGEGDLPQRAPVHPDHVRPLRVPKPLQQADQGGLAAAGAAHDGQGLPGGHVHADILQRRADPRRRDRRKVRSSESMSPRSPVMEGSPSSRMSGFSSRMARMRLSEAMPWETAETASPTAIMGQTSMPT